MTNRTGNYCAFYADTLSDESNLGVNAVEDFRYYNLLKAWKEMDSTFPFVDSHNKNYNVRDNSDWETTLKPRLHERLRLSKNIILFLSSKTKNSTALREEIDYGINNQGLPVIVVYPEYESPSEIIAGNGKFNASIVKLWDKLPVFRDSMLKVPTIHIPLSKSILRDILGDRNFEFGTKIDAKKYY
jgi:hypothetical protein